MVKSLGFAFVLAALLGAAANAPAETTFVAVLNGAQNVPPLNVPGTGMATMILNDAQDQLSYALEYQDLTSPENDAHFHNAGPRDIGPVVHQMPLGTPKVGVWNIPPDMVTELFAGNIYVNIHTEVYILGEIRGSVTQATPVQSSTWGRIKALYE